MNHQHNDKCPRCGEGRLHTWRELSDEEREVMRRLPDSAAYTLDERRATHRWCPRCWFEATGGASRNA